MVCILAMEVRRWIIVICFVTFGLVRGKTFVFRWGICEPLKGSRDQNCAGEHTRLLLERDDRTKEITNKTTETKSCLITPDVVDGGYTDWAPWADCSGNCNGNTVRYRFCNNPTPCNGGRNCTDLGTNKLQKQCGPVDGQWGNWAEWGVCVIDDTSSIYGTGTHIRYRFCNESSPICGGDYCDGSNSNVGNCRVTPICLTSTILDEKFLRIDSPLVIYTSKKVEIYPLTKNKCTVSTIIYNYWELYQINATSGKETQIGNKTTTLLFKVDSAIYEAGLYRLYVKIGYPVTMQHWMEESMYLRIVHPPPHAFIRGGNGITIGKGIVELDARSGSYSLTKRAGDPSGLSFQWSCMNFITWSLYKLLQLNIDSSSAFDDEIEQENKWYQTSFTRHIEEQVPWINASMLYKRVAFYRNSSTNCSIAEQLYVKVQNNSVLDSGDNDTDTNQQQVQLVTLTEYYNIRYMSDYDNETQLLKEPENMTPLPQYNTLVKNELLTFMSFYFGSNNTFVNEAEQFYVMLSNSYLTLESVYQLKNLEGVQESVNASFFPNLSNWLNTANQASRFAYRVVELLNQYAEYNVFITRGLEMADLTGIDSYIHLNIDASEACLLTFLGEIMEGFYEMNYINWFDLKNTERYYLQWMKDELFKSSACKSFTEFEDGTANLTVSDADVLNGMGYLVNVRVDFEGSVSYFTQYVQSLPGNPPKLDVECRLNCMAKTALTSIMSLTASCPSCTVNQLLGGRFSWNVKDFNFQTRQAIDNPNWESWMLTEILGRKFVMKANVLNANTGYIIEVSLELSDGEIATGIWVVITNILPYGGTCQLENSFWDERRVTATNWKDEGFRNSITPSLDWKEQLNYRIVQMLGDTETLLYYGYEVVNYVTLKPGLPSDNYIVTVKVQIFDIFIDYAECSMDAGKIYPEYTTVNASSVSSYLTLSAENINYYWQSGNAKQVALNTEVASSSVTDLGVPETIFDMDPYNWVNISVTSTDNGTTRYRSFDELWDIYQHPDLGDTVSNNEIISQLSSFADILDKLSDELLGTSTVNIQQIANSIGTTVINKEFVANISASSAFNANKKLLDKLVLLADNEAYPKYEDFISTCEGILRILNNALEGILPNLSSDIPYNIDMDHIMNFLADKDEVLHSSTGMLTTIERAYMVEKVAVKKQLDAQMKTDMVEREVPGLLDAISTLGKVLQMLTYRKQLPVFVFNSHMNATQETRYVEELLIKGFQHDHVNIDFLQGSMISTEEQNVQVTLYDHTPFAWDQESKYISSKTVTVSVQDKNSMAAVIPSKIKLKNSYVRSPTSTVLLAVPVDQNEPTSQSFINKMYWNNPDDDLVLTLHNVLEDLTHNVFVSNSSNPSESNYDWRTKIQDATNSSMQEIKLIVRGNLYKKPCLVYIGVHMSRKTDVKSIGISRTRRSLETTVVNYNISIFTTGCRVWDQYQQIWDKSSCKVSNSSTVYETTCECNNPPGNSFATTFYVPPNSIDFSSVFSKFDIKDNAAVLSTVICVILLYLFINIWAYKQDKKDPERWALSYLSDNSPLDDYLYILTVYTGLYLNSGTTSNVQFMIIEGDKGRGRYVNEEVRCLKNDHHKGFDTGSVKRFVMSVTKRIRDPSVLKLWHDNSGTGNDASWYLSKVILEDIKRQEKYTFICNKWFSLDHEDGTIEHAFPVCDKQEESQLPFLFKENSRHNITDNHLWLSVVMLPEKCNFTRMQRLACCLTLLFLTMISNAMFFKQDTGSQIAIGPLNVTSTIIYISVVSALITAPIIVLITYLFRKSKKVTTKTQRECEINFAEKTMPPLPYGCIIVAWSLVWISVLISAFFVILYSIEWGKSKSEEWLLCFFISFIESMFIVDPVKVIVISLLFSLICTKRDNQTIYDRDTLLYETKKHAGTTFSNGLKRQMVIPLTEPRVSKLRRKRKAELKMRNVLMELVLYLTFLSILYLVSYSNRDPRWFYSKQHIDQQLIEQTNITRGDGTLRYSQVISTESFYTFLNDTVIPYMFPQYSVTGNLLTPNERLFIRDLVNYRVGPLRIRQVRVKEGLCEYSLLNLTCFGQYSISEEEDSNFCVGWQNGPCPVNEPVYNISSAAWTHVSSDDIWGLPTIGLYSTYGGGGYIADLLVNYQISNQILNDLYKYKWIDRRTRAVFIETTFYNADENVFIFLSLLSEFPELGGVLTSTSIKPFRPYQHVGSLGIFTFVCELLALIGMVIFAVKKAHFLKSHGKKSLKDVWNVLEVTIVSLFFICTAIYIVRWVMVNHAMEKFLTNKNKFVNFRHIAYWDEIFNILLAIIVYFITVRLMKILNCIRRVNHMGYIFSHVSRHLCGVLVMFLLVFVAFVGFGYLIFGRQLITYKNMFVSSTTLTNAIIGKNSINNLFSVEPVLGRVYYFLFVFFLLWIMLTMLNATLNLGISEAKQHILRRSPAFDLSQYVSQLLTSTIGMFTSSKGTQHKRSSRYNVNKNKKHTSTRSNMKKTYK